MAYTNPRGLGVSDQGNRLETLMACTLADYTSGGTQTPLVGDVVTFSATGNYFVKRAGDDTFANVGVVTKVELAPVSTALGYVAVEWIDVQRFVSLPCATLANATLGDACSKVGDDTHSADWDAADALSTNKLLCIAKSAATGAGTIAAAVIQ